MDLSDEDLFAFSDKDEPMETVVNICNPVEEHLFKERIDITMRVERAKSNLKGMQQVSNEILEKLQSRATRAESSSSDSETELYQVTGEPVTKKKCIRRTTDSQQPLEVLDVWQKVVDDKWIVGVVMKNTSHRILRDLSMYVFVKNESEIRWTTNLWSKFDESFWEKTDELNNASEQLVATTVLDIPNFKDNEFIEAFATLAYAFDGKELQTAVTTFRLAAIEVIDRSRAPRFSTDPEISVLAIKAISVERTLAISLDGNPGRGLCFLDFLDKIGFNEIVSDVYVSKQQESFRHCIIEILQPTESQFPVRISARSACQLDIIVKIVKDDFPDANELETDNKLWEAASILESELKLQLAGADTARIRIASIHTDLLIP